MNAPERDTTQTIQYRSNQWPRTDDAKREAPSKGKSALRRGSHGGGRLFRMSMRPESQQSDNVDSERWVADGQQQKAHALQFTNMERDSEESAEQAWLALVAKWASAIRRGWCYVLQLALRPAFKK